MELEELLQARDKQAPSQQQAPPPQQQIPPPQQQEDQVPTGQPASSAAVEPSAEPLKAGPALASVLAVSNQAALPTAAAAAFLQAHDTSGDALLQHAQPLLNDADADGGGGGDEDVIMSEVVQHHGLKHQDTDMRYVHTEAEYEQGGQAGATGGKADADADPSGGLHGRRRWSLAGPPGQGPMLQCSTSTTEEPGQGTMPSRPPLPSALRGLTVPALDLAKVAVQRPGEDGFAVHSPPPSAPAGRSAGSTGGKIMLPTWERPAAGMPSSRAPKVPGITRR